MWLFTKVGFFSVVEASEDRKEIDSLTSGFKFEGAQKDDTLLSIRARIEGDLDLLRAQYAPGLSPTVILGAHRDYPYRAYISKEKFAEAMCRAALDIDYGNFKSMIMRVFGMAREVLYAKVWGVMNEAEKKIGTEKTKKVGSR